MNSSTHLTSVEQQQPEESSSGYESEAEEFKKPMDVPPVQKKIKKKKKLKACRCNASFATIQKILESLEYHVLGMMKDDPEKAGSIIHLIEHDFAPKLDAIDQEPMTAARKLQRTCTAKKHNFLFWDALGRLDVVYGV